MSVDLLALLATAGLVGLFVGTSVLAGRGFGLEQRAGLLERRDPGTAAALRRAQSVTDFASVGIYANEGFSAVCTPSRRSGLEMARLRATDSDLRVEAAEETLPPMPATVVALGDSRHVATAPRTRHPHRSGQPTTTAPQPAGTAKSAGHQPTASG